MPMNSREVMILVFFQNFGKWRWLPEFFGGFHPFLDDAFPRMRLTSVENQII